MAIQEPTPAPANAEEQAAAFYAWAGSSSQATSDAKGLESGTTPVPVAPLPTPKEPPLVEEVKSVEEQAQDFYGPGVPTRGHVDWNEPPAQPREYDLTAPYGVIDTSEAGAAAMNRLREGFAAAGAGKTLAAELFQDAVRSKDGSGVFAVSRDTAEQNLRQHYGPRYEAQIAAAQGLIRQVAQRCPEVISFLERTRLGNDPEFVKKVVAAAQVARRRGAVRPS